MQTFLVHTQKKTRKNKFHRQKHMAHTCGNPLCGYTISASKSHLSGDLNSCSSYCYVQVHFKSAQISDLNFFICFDYFRGWEYFFIEDVPRNTGLIAVHQCDRSHFLHWYCNVNSVALPMILILQRCKHDSIILFFLQVIQASTNNEGFY